MTRKPLSKKIRFEVLKRDHFTCQYCGAKSPDVILEVDHIKPVAEGGTNDMFNLITSCRDCNRGKGKRALSDNAELNKQRNELDDLAALREQTDMMIEWRRELSKTIESQVNFIEEYIDGLTNMAFTDYGRGRIKKLIREFSFNEVCTAVEIAFDYYWQGDKRTWEKAFKKIGGICYNRRKQENGNL